MAVKKWGHFLNKLFFIPMDLKNKLEFFHTITAVGDVLDHPVFIFFRGLSSETFNKDFRRKAVFTVHLCKIGDTGCIKPAKHREINLHTRFPFPEVFFLDH